MLKFVLPLYLNIACQILHNALTEHKTDITFEVIKDVAIQSFLDMLMRQFFEQIGVDLPYFQRIYIGA